MGSNALAVFFQDPVIDFDGGENQHKGRRQGNADIGEPGDFRRQLHGAEEDPAAQQQEEDQQRAVEGIHQDLVESGLGPVRPAADIFVEKPGDQKAESHPQPGRKPPSASHRGTERE